MRTHVSNRHATVAFLSGGLVGAGALFFFAPWSGKETRRKIEELAETIKGKAECYAGQVKADMSCAVEKGRHFINEKKAIMTTAVEAAKKAYEEEKKRARTTH